MWSGESFNTYELFDCWFDCGRRSRSSTGSSSISDRSSNWWRIFLIWFVVGSMWTASVWFFILQFVAGLWLAVLFRFVLHLFGHFSDSVIVEGVIGWRWIGWFDLECTGRIWILEYLNSELKPIGKENKLVMNYIAFRNVSLRMCCLSNDCHALVNNTFAMLTLIKQKNIKTRKESNVRRVQHSGWQCMYNEPDSCNGKRYRPNRNESQTMYRETICFKSKRKQIRTKNNLLISINDWFVRVYIMEQW